MRPVRALVVGARAPRRAPRRRRARPRRPQLPEHLAGEPREHNSRLRVWRCRGCGVGFAHLVVLCCAVFFLGSGRAEPARRLLQESAGELVRNFSPLDFPCTGPTELSWLRGLLMS